MPAAKQTEPATNKSLEMNIERNIHELDRAGDEIAANTLATLLRRVCTASTCEIDKIDCDHLAPPRWLASTAQAWPRWLCCRLRCPAMLQTCLIHHSFQTPLSSTSIKGKESGRRGAASRDSDAPGVLVTGSNRFTLGRPPGSPVRVHSSTAPKRAGSNWRAYGPRQPLCAPSCREDRRRRVGRSAPGIACRASFAGMNHNLDSGSMH